MLGTITMNNHGLFLEILAFSPEVEDMFGFLFVKARSS